MTVQEIKLDLLRRGMIITEFIGSDTPQGTVSINVTKFDTDGLRVSADSPVYATDYYSDEKYSELIKERGLHIENYITNRHAKNINTCQHNEVMIGSRVACSFCMGTFGNKIMLDIRGN